MIPDLQETIVRLRAFANWLESHPAAAGATFHQATDGTILVLHYVTTSDEGTARARQLGGHWKAADMGDDHYGCEQRIAPGVRYQIYTSARAQAVA